MEARAHQVTEMKASSPGFPISSTPPPPPLSLCAHPLRAFPLPICHQELLGDAITRSQESARADPEVLSSRSVSRCPTQPARCCCCFSCC